MTELEIVEQLMKHDKQWVAQALYGRISLPDNRTRLAWIRTFLLDTADMDEGFVLEVVKRLTNR